MPKFSYKKRDIQALVYLAQKDDIKALEELVRRVQKNIYALFAHLVDKKEDISDLTQETLLKMAKSLPQLKDATKFKSWLNQIATNNYYDYIKKNPHKYIELSEEDFNEIKDKIGCGPGERCIFSEIERLVKIALQTLPLDLRITIVLREYEGLSYSEIARITNTAIGTVKSRISRARIKLQNELKEFI
jgi:RNA polymerase sigma-70 factor (ECF subfamily)